MMAVMWLHQLLQDWWAAPGGAILSVIALFFIAYWVRSALFTLISSLFLPQGNLPSMPKPPGHDFRETMRLGIMKV